MKSFLVALAMAILVTIGGCTVKPTMLTCDENNEIPAPKRAAIEQSALQFVQTILSDDSQAAYSQLAPDARTNLSLDTFTSMIASIQKVGSFQNLDVTNTYFISGSGSPTRMVCGKPSDPGEQVFVAVAPVPEQAHVILQADTTNNTWAFVLWMLPDKGAWHPEHFNLAAMAIGGKSADDFFKLAREQREHHHDFNAYILYATAAQLASRGANLQLGIESQIQEAMKQVPTPPELAGKPPYLWRFGDDTFSVVRAGPVSVDGKLYLVVSHQLSPWPDDQAADARNHRLIDDFTKAHPDYSDAFNGGMIAEAREANGAHGYRTVSAPP